MKTTDTMAVFHPSHTPVSTPNTECLEQNYEIWEKPNNSKISNSEICWPEFPILCFLPAAHNFCLPLLAHTVITPTLLTCSQSCIFLQDQRGTIFRLPAQRVSEVTGPNQDGEKSERKKEKAEHSAEGRTVFSTWCILKQPGKKKI